MNKSGIQFDKFRRIHFIGIGGISMSSIAVILKRIGYEVSGSDRGESELTRSLEAEGIVVKLGQKRENIAGCELVVYTAAISDDNPELKAAREGGIPCITRAEALGALMLGYKNRVGIAGTHGKSTTTAMIAAIMTAAGLDPTLINGAVDGESGKAYRLGGKDLFVFEACEYTDSFLSFYPTTAVVTNVEFDHADYFHSVGQYIASFGKYLASAETAVVNLDSENSRAAIEGYAGKLYTCSCKDKNADFFADNIALEHGFAHLDIIYKQTALCHIELSVPGLHNASNALTAAAAAYVNGSDIATIKRGLEGYRGIKRRMEYCGKLQSGARLFDDYAHHPTEIKASLSAAKALGGRVICAFQPHSLSRTAELFDDFTKAFADADKLYLTDIYENLELDTGLHSVSSKDLAAAIKGAEYVGDFDLLARKIMSEAKEGDDIIIMGAGDISKLCSVLKCATLKKETR